MKLGQHPSELEQVTFDIESIDEKRREASMHSVFNFGWASFENPIYDAVAANHGINEAGELDMNMVDAAQQVAEYVEGKHGQPLVLLDVARKPESDRDFEYMAGYFGRLALEGPLVGVFNHSAGIALEGEHTQPHLYMDTNGDYRAQYLNVAKGLTIPLRSSHLTVGVPGDDGRPELTYEQDLVVGEDIISWIEETFKESDRYHFYADLVGCLIRNAGDTRDFSMLDPLAVEPYLSLVNTDIDTYEAVERTIKDYEFKVDNAQKVVAGHIAQANLDLAAIADAHPAEASRLPRTSDSYSIGLTDPFDNVYGPQIKQRRDAMAWHRDPLLQLRMRAIQIERGE